MCDQINPGLRKRMILEMAEDIRKWFREWRRRNTATGDMGLHQTCSRPTDGLRATW